MKKTIFTYSLLLLIFNLSFSQNPEWKWAKSSNSEYSNNIFYKSIVDSDNNLYSIGSFYLDVSFDNLKLTSNRSNSLFISKFDSNGNIKWLKKIEYYNTFGISGFEIDNNNNLLITGNVTIQSFTHNINFNDEVNIPFDNTSNLGTNRYFSFKLNSDGEFLWSDTDFGASSVSCTSMDSENNYYSFGSYSGSITIEDTTLNSNSGLNDFFIYKKNNNNLIWAKKFDFVSQLNKVQIKTIGNNEIILICETFSETFSYQGTDYFMGNTGIRKLMILKFNQEGNLISIKHILNPPTNEFNTHILHIDDFGHIYICGTFNTNTIDIKSTILTKIGDEDIFISKFDSNGNLITAKNIGAPNTSFFVDNIITKNENLILATDFSISNSPNTLTINNTNHICNGFFTTLIIKLDSVLDYIWTKSATGIGTSNGNFPSTINYSNMNDFFVTGFYNCENIDFDNFNLLTSNSNATDNSFVAKISENNLSTESFQIKKVMMFPNPTHDYLKFNLEILSDYTIYDSLGKLTSKGSLNSKVQSINVKNLKEGIYLLKIDNSNYRFIKN